MFQSVDRLSDPVGRSRVARLLTALGLTGVLGAACAPTPTVTPLAPPTFDEKVSWVLRLENQRVVRDAPPEPQTPETEGDAPQDAPVSPAPSRPQPDLVGLLSDPEPQLRRRAALALGRVGVPEGVVPLTSALQDAEVEVRQMSAFALGLIGRPDATAALVEALADPEPLVQGRAAEALARIGATEAAAPIAEVVRRHVASAFDLDPDDLSHPLSPEVEAFRLGLFALGRLGAYEPLADVVLQQNGQPILWWWPVAYALQRTGDPRAIDPLITLAGVQGTVGVAFAARGLGAIAAPDAAPRVVDALVALLDLERRDERVIATAIQALAQVDEPQVGEALLEFALLPDLSPTLRLEALRALEQRPAAGSNELFVELMTARWPPMRGGALQALARGDAETFMLVLSGLGRDTDWRVRTALAEALAHVDADGASYRLTQLLQDDDHRVIPATLRSLARQRASELPEVLAAHLDHDDVVVRKTAAILLGDVGTEVDAPAQSEIASALARAFVAAEADASYLARAAILDALTQLDVPATRDTLTAALDDADWAVRIRAADALETLDPGGAHNSAIRPAPGRRSVDFTSPQLVRPSVSPHIYIELERGTIELELNVIDAPLTSDNFMTLARSGFYDGLTFHRVVPNYVVQGGDPRGDSEGGPGYTMRDELSQQPFLRGTVGMARDWQDTGGSQFFITHSPQPDLDARYTAFGRVVDGMEVVDSIQPGDVIRRVLVWDGVSPF